MSLNPTASKNAGARYCALSFWERAPRTVQYIRMGEELRSIDRQKPLTQLSPLYVWCSPLPKGEGTTKSASALLMQ
jgi:hypothetical protein